MRYKPGQAIRIKNVPEGTVFECPISRLTFDNRKTPFIGETLHVTETDDRDNTYRFDRTGPLWFAESWLEPVAESSSRPPQERGRIPIGARVSVIGDRPEAERGGSAKGVRIGKAGKIKEDDCPALPYRVVFDNGGYGWFREQDLAILDDTQGQGHRHFFGITSDLTVGEPRIGATTRPLMFSSPSDAAKLMGKPSEASGLRDYQRVMMRTLREQMQGPPAFYTWLGDPFAASSSKPETRKQIRERLLNL